VIFPLDAPMMKAAGLTVLSGNLFDNAVMKLSVISDEFRARYLSNPDDPGAFEGVAVVFDGPEDYHHRIDDPALGIDARFDPDHARRGAGRLSRRRRSGEHAAARGADPGGRACAALPRRRAAIGHQRLARRSSTPRPKRRWAAGWRWCAPATVSASI
jgi:hypothetical protein